MSKKRGKKSRKHSRRTGMEGTKKRRSKKHYGVRHQVYVHGSAGTKPAHVATNVLAGIIAAIATAFATSKIPPTVPVIGSSKMKPLIPAGIGFLALSKVGKKIPGSTGIALSSFIISGLGLVKNFMPTVPIMSGVDSVPELTPQTRTLLLGAVSKLVPTMGAVNTKFNLTGDSSGAQRYISRHDR